MTYCKNCGAELPANAKFCSKCGTPVGIQGVERAQAARPARRSMSPLMIAGIAVLAIVVVAALIAIPLLLGGLLPFGRVVGSGNARTQQETMSDFNVVDVGSGFRVHIAHSNSYKVSITADDNLFQYIQVFKTGSTMTIRLTPGVSVQSSTLKAEITMPTLIGVQFSGGVIGNATGFISTQDFRVELSGGSTLKMDGEANNLVAACSGGSSLDLSKFTVANADIDFSGGSQGTINLSGRLNANLSGGSKLFYIGSPTLGDISTSGGSSITGIDQS